MPGVSPVRFTIVVATVCAELQLAPVAVLFQCHSPRLLVSVSVALVCVTELEARPMVSADSVTAPPRIRFTAGDQTLLFPVPRVQ